MASIRMSLSRCRGQSDYLQVGVGLEITQLYSYLQRSLEVDTDVSDR